MADPLLLNGILLFLVTIQFESSYCLQITFPKVPTLPSLLNPDGIADRMTDTVRRGIRLRNGQEAKDDNALERFLAQNHQNMFQTTALGGWRDNISSRILYRFMRSYFSQDPNEAVKFFLYDGSNDPSSAKEVFINDQNSLSSIKVPEGSQLKILIHGFTASANSSFPQDMKNAFLQNTNYSVICVDWSPMAGFRPLQSPLRHLAEGIVYNGIADFNVPRVGHHVARFIYEVRRINVVSSLDQVHLIGHSLGAHVSGEAGLTLQKELTPDENKVGRITGLDPANPHFENKTNEHRLEESDGKFVDIIHTSHLLGDRRSSGHLDFYPNPDSFPQPGCEEKNQTLGKVIPYALRNLIGSCDHHRAVDFYSASITDQNYIGCKFQSTDADKHNHDTGAGADQERRDKPRRFHKCSEECDKSVVFGEHANHSIRGEYCLILKIE